MESSDNLTDRNTLFIEYAIGKGADDSTTFKYPTPFCVL